MLAGRNSVTIGWYRIEPRTRSAGSAIPTVSVDDLVLVTLPAEAATLAAQRRYLPVGVPLLKWVGAVAPQDVSVGRLPARSPPRSAPSSCLAAFGPPLAQGVVCRARSGMEGGVDGGVIRAAMLAAGLAPSARPAARDRRAARPAMMVASKRDAARSSAIVLAVDAPRVLQHLDRLPGEIPLFDYVLATVLAAPRAAENSSPPTCRAPCLAGQPGGGRSGLGSALDWGGPADSSCIRAVNWAAFNEGCWTGRFCPESAQPDDGVAATGEPAAREIHVIDPIDQVRPKCAASCIRTA